MMLSPYPRETLRVEIARSSLHEWQTANAREESPTVLTSRTDPAGHQDVGGINVNTCGGTNYIGGCKIKSTEVVAGDAASKTQNTTATVAPVTTTPLVIDKIIVTVEAAAEKGFDISLGAIGGTIVFIFASSQEAASEKKDTHGPEKNDSAEPELAPASGGSDKGVRGARRIAAARAT